MDMNELETLERNNWYRGTVQFFDSREDKSFGFLTIESVPAGKKEIFFHLNDGCPVIAGSKEVIIRLRKPVEHEPRKGDVILFRLTKGSKGFKATPWCYLTEYEKAKEIVQTGEGDHRFDDDNLDRRDLRQRMECFQSAAGWIRPEHDEALFEHILKQSRVTF